MIFASGGCGLPAWRVKMQVAMRQKCHAAKSRGTTSGIVAKFETLGSNSAYELGGPFHWRLWE
jgi:hypothetical protein